MIIPTLKKGGTIGVFTPSYPITAKHPMPQKMLCSLLNQKATRLREAFSGAKMIITEVVLQRKGQRNLIRCFMMMRLTVLWQA